MIALSCPTSIYRKPQRQPHRAVRVQFTASNSWNAAKLEVSQGWELITQVG